MDEKLGVGDVIEGTIARLQENMQPALVFIAILTLMGTVLEGGFAAILDNAPGGYEMPEIVRTAFGIGAGLGGLLFVIVSIVGTYLLWEVVLRRSGFAPPDGEKRVFRYFLQAIIVGFCTGIGFLLLIVPGLIFGARWAAAPAFLIAEKRGTIQAMGDSWETVRGNTTSVVLAYLIGVVGVVVLGLAFASIGGGVASVLLEHLIANIGTVLTVALGVFLYGRLHGDSDRIAQVFD